MEETVKTDLLRRARGAYFRNGTAAQEQPASDSAVHAVGGKDYVVLRNTNGVLAVYRSKNNGALKKLVRWPKALEADGQAEIFRATGIAKGVISNTDLPQGAKATAWDSFGEIECVEFEDGSVFRR